MDTSHVPSITINGISYSYDQVTSFNTVPKTEFEKNILIFCRAWLTGKSEFTLTTSGSTGKPRTVLLTRHQMTESALKMEKVLGLKPEYTALLCLDARYIAGQMMLVRSFVSGMKIYAIEPSANPFDNIPNDIGIHFTALVPYQLNAILDSNNLKRFEQVNCTLVGGAPIEAQLKTKIQSLPCPLYATYGMTETASAIALQKLNTPSREHYFQTLPGILLRQDERGCLIVEADYLGAAIVTNDLIVLKEKDQFQWLGRWDHVINSGGIKIVPEIVETQLGKVFFSLQLTNRFFVMGMPDKVLGQKTCLFIEGDPFSGTLKQTFKNKIEMTLERYVIPKETHFIPHFTETKSGKINRKKSSVL